LRIFYKDSVLSPNVGCPSRKHVDECSVIDGVRRRRMWPVATHTTRCEAALMYTDAIGATSP